MPQNLTFEPSNPVAQEHARPLQILRPREAARKVDASISTLYRWVGDPAFDFPKPIRLGANSSGFLEHELDAWLKNRIAERDRALQDFA